MTIQARFAHTNLIAQDWRKLADFYEQVLGCTPVPPERHHSGQWFEDVTGIPGAEIQGMHLRLPGHGDNGPTLEIFQYNYQQEWQEPAINRPGFAHIAFAVDDVKSAKDAVIAAGGGVIGQTVSVDIPMAGKITLVYATDPEGNILELQHWSQVMGPTSYQAK